MKKIYVEFIQYLVDHNNHNDNYLNRYFVLKGRFINEKKYKEHDIDKAKNHLLKSGFIKVLTTGMLYPTDEGKNHLHQVNRIYLMDYWERFTQFFNKKLIAVPAIAGLLLTAIGLFNKEEINNFINIFSINFLSQTVNKSQLIIDHPKLGSS